jgi:hypothetical protein
MTTMMSDLFSVMCNRFSAYRWWQTGYWLLIMGYCLLITACANPGIECEDDLGCVEVGPDDSIQLGYLLALSGEAAYLGEDAWQAVELAMSQRGTLLGHPLELIGFDTGCDVAMGRSVAIEASDFSTILGIIGTTCSAVAEAVLPIISRAGMVMVSPTNTTDNVPQLDDELGQLSFFRTAPNELWQAEVAASFAREESHLVTRADHQVLARLQPAAREQTAAVVAPVVERLEAPVEAGHHQVALADGVAAHLAFRQIRRPQRNARRRRHSITSSRPREFKKRTAWSRTGAKRLKTS